MKEDKEGLVGFPTLAEICVKLNEVEGLPVFTKYTTHYVMRKLGFRYE